MAVAGAGAWDAGLCERASGRALCSRWSVAHLPGAPTRREDAKQEAVFNSDATGRGDSVLPFAVVPDYDNNYSRRYYELSVVIVGASCSGSSDFGQLTKRSCLLRAPQPPSRATAANTGDMITYWTHDCDASPRNAACVHIHLI